MVTWELKDLIAYAKGKVRAPAPAPESSPKSCPRSTGRSGYNRQIVETFFSSNGLFPCFEYRFHPDRKWRFDLAWPWAKVALEVQGGIWTQGRHIRGAALKREWEKLNTAACMGWRILYCEPKDLCTHKTMWLIQSATRTSP